MGGFLQPTHYHKKEETIIVGNELDEDEEDDEQMSCKTKDSEFYVSWQVEL